MTGLLRNPKRRSIVKSVSLIFDYFFQRTTKWTIIQQKYNRRTSILKRVFLSRIRSDHFFFRLADELFDGDENISGLRF